MLKQSSYRLLYLLTLLLLCLPQPSTAVEKADFRFGTTRDLYTLCSVAADDPDYAAAMYACRGYIAGAVDYHDGVSNQEDLKRLICYPESTTLKDGREAFVAWAEKRQDDKVMDQQAVVGLVKALAAKYPCNK